MPEKNVYGGEVIIYIYIYIYIYMLICLIGNATRIHCCSCPRQGLRFPMSYVMVFLVFCVLRKKFTLCFVDIGGIVDHH